MGPKYWAGSRHCRWPVESAGAGGPMPSVCTASPFIPSPPTNSQWKDISMFTGIIEELGTVENTGARLTVGCSTVLEDLAEGASIAVNGVCLTAVDLRPGSFSA